MWYEMQWQCVIHSTSHRLQLNNNYFTSNHISGTAHHTTSHIIPHILYITHGVMWIVWCGIWCDVESFAMPDVGRCALCILMLWCGVRCDWRRICAICVTLQVILCHAMSDEKCGDAMWNDGVVHVEYGGVLWRCEMLWNTERCGMVWRRHIRHGGVMRNDGLNAVCDVWCCGIVWCEIYIRMCMAWNVGTMWNGAPKCDLMLNMVWCQCMWNVVRRECCHFKMLNVVSWYVECCGRLRCDVNVVVWKLWWWRM